jgi:hypothetical protein
MYLIGTRAAGVGIWDYHSKQLVATLPPSVEQRYYSHMYSCSTDVVLAVRTGSMLAMVIWDISIWLTAE